MSLDPNQEIITAQNLGKKFYRYHTGRPTTFLEVLIRGLQGMKPKEVFGA